MRVNEAKRQRELTILYHEQKKYQQLINQNKVLNLRVTVYKI